MEKPDPENPLLFKTKKDYFYYKNNFKKCQKLLKRKDKNVTKFERLSTSREDNSAIISLILRLFENDKFWKNQNLEFIMKCFAEQQNGNIKNLLSILMFDWHEQSDDVLHNYYLEEKFENFKKFSYENKSLFEYLLEISEKHKIYSQICIKIISNYFEGGHQLQNIDLHNLMTATFELNDREYRNQILKILVLNTKVENYKSKIFQQFEDQKDSHKSYYGSILNHCDEHFFKLAFYLKEHSIANFKVDYKHFVKTYQHYFGDYWTHAIQSNCQLLYNIAKKENLKDILDFLSFEMLNMDLNQQNINKISEFLVVFNEPLEKDDRNILKSLRSFMEDKYTEVHIFNIDKFKNAFKNTPVIRRLFFGREKCDSNSIFEDILHRLGTAANHQKSNDIYNYVWEEFKLNETPEIMTVKNHQGKRIIDYILDSGCDDLLITFLKPESGTKSKKKPANQWMMLKNSLICQYFDDEDSLIKFQLKLINDNNFWINLKNLLYYFEEASQYGQINNSSALSNLVQQSILYSKDDGALKKQLFLGLVMIYNSKSDNNLLESRLNDIPFFKLLTLVLNERESDFIESFPKEYIKMEQNVKETATVTKGIDPATTQSFYEDCLTHLSFVLLYAAMKTNQTKIMIKIFEFNNFSNIKIEFPDNMAVKEVIKDLTILKFLEKKYEIIKSIFPASWITPKILEKFLDSRITSENGTYKVDCQFMHPFSKDTKIESNDVIEYILNDYELKPLVTHPVIEVILRTKLTANSFMFFWNFIIFMLSYVAPTMLLAFEYHSDNKSLNCTEVIDLDMDYRCTNGQGLNYFMIYALIAIRLPYIIGREYLQYLVFYERDYFKIMSNYFECGLIVASIIQIMLTFVYQCSMLYNLFILLSIAEAINVFLMTIAIGYLFPFLNFPIYMICFKKILFTYLNIFVVFLPLFIGSATLIFIIFDKNFGGKIEDFYDLGNAFMKYIIMFSGEMGIDPKELNGFMQGAVITLVIIFIINQSNLILSIVVNDIQGVMDESKKSNLVFIGWRYVELVRNEAKFGTILNGPRTKSIGHKLIKACFKIVKYFRSRLDYGYQLKYIYIEKETDDVHVVFNKFRNDDEVLRSQHITERQNNVFMRKVIGWWKQLSGNYIVNEEIKDKVEKIVMRRD